MSKRHIVTIVAAVALVAIAALAYVFRADSARLAKVFGVREAATPAAETYVCPMHPEVVSDRPGQTCPKCGMDLVKESGLRPRRQTDDAAGHAEHDAAPDATPRAAVSLDLRRQQSIGVRLAVRVAHDHRAPGAGRGHRAVRRDRHVRRQRAGRRVRARALRRRHGPPRHSWTAALHPLQPRPPRHRAGVPARASHAAISCGPRPATTTREVRRAPGRGRASAAGAVGPARRTRLPSSSARRAARDR